jgi:glycosyltransferase involved in cell wall biosynthesis
VLAGYLRIQEAGISVVYNGLDFELLQPVRSREEVMAELPASARTAFVVGTASKLQPLKRVHLLLRALQELRDQRVHGVILGDGPARAGLEELSAALGLVERVSFLGQKEHVGDYLQLMDAFVLPSGPEEAFGNAAVEAMGVGVPTIVFSDGGGLTEHVTDRVTGRVVGDVRELAEAITELAGDEIVRQRLGEAGRSHARTEYSLDRMAERYEALYEVALDARRSPA